MTIKRCSRVVLVLLFSVAMVPLAGATERWGYGGLGITDSDLDRSGFDDETGYKIFGGYQMNKYFAIEIAFVDFGDFKSGTSRVSEDGFQGTAVGMINFGEAFRLFGKGGVFRDGGTDVTYGFGMEWGRKFGVRLEWERFADISGSADVEMLSVSGMFNFGKRRK